MTEQVWEAKSTSNVVEALKIVGDQSEAIFLLGRELGQRRSADHPGPADEAKGYLHPGLVAAGELA